MGQTTTCPTRPAGVDFDREQERWVPEEKGDGQNLGDCRRVTITVFQLVVIQVEPITCPKALAATFASTPTLSLALPVALALSLTLALALAIALKVELALALTLTFPLALNLTRTLSLARCVLQLPPQEESEAAKGICRDLLAYFSR